jgi:hypothetical protein
MNKHNLYLRNDTLNPEEEHLLLLHQTLKLQIELVPASCFWSNVRNNIEVNQWDQIRKRVYKKANHMCEICGGKGKYHPVECHEVWLYDYSSMTQKLDFFQALCPFCHEVKHIGLAGIRGTGKRAFNHFASFNGLDEVTAGKIEDAVFRQWEIRSDLYWKLDIKHLKEWGELLPNGK